MDASVGRSQGRAEGDNHYDAKLGAYVSVAKGAWWAIVLVVVAATVAAFVFSSAQPHRYEAAARIWYGGSITGSGTLALEVNGIDATLQGSDLSKRVASKMGRGLPKHADVTISAIPLSMTDEGQAAGPLTATRLVAVKAEAGNPMLAAQMANAYAKAFVQYRTSLTRNAARESIRTVRKQLLALRQPAGHVGATAASVTASFVDLTRQLATLEFTATRGSGGYTVLSPAVPPAKPFSPRVVRSSMLGFFVGLFLAAILIVLLHGLGDLAREEDVAALLRLPILGRLSRSNDEQPGAAEASRRLRASLFTVLASGGVKRLLFTSAFEGEGTSAALADVAIAMARTGKRVIGIDANLRDPGLHIQFSLPNDEGVTSVVTGRANLGTALHQVDVALEAEPASGPGTAVAGGVRPSLQVLTSGPDVLDPGDLVAGEAMRDMVAELETDSDIVLIASPGLLDVADASSLAGVVDGLVFIVTVRGTSRSALRHCRDYLDLLSCRQVGVVIMQQPRTSWRFGQRRTRRY